MQLTRRFFLQAGGALSTYLGVLPLDVLAAAPAPAARRAVTKRRTLVVIFLRGGADGLNLVVPHGDPHYARLRPTLGLAAPGSRGGALDLDGTFGLHPRLEPLLAHFEAGHAVAAHAVGSAHNTRSHFEEQDVWETGVIGNTVGSDGWVNRHLATSEGHGSIRAVAVGDALPRLLHGRAPAYAVRGVEDLTLPAMRGVDPERVAAALEHAYCTEPEGHRARARDLLERTAATTLDGIEQLRAITRVPYAPAVEYPRTDLAQRLMQVARLIKADVGLEVAEVDFGGWDTHRNQGAGAGGSFGNLAGQLGTALDAFARDLEERLDDVVVVTLTDFGRTAAENGTGGTDHGWANALLLMGGAVARARREDGRRVVADWPGLGPDELHEGRDLLHTTDFRDVIAEVVRIHLGNPNLETVLPAHEFAPVGLIA